MSSPLFAHVIAAPYKFGFRAKKDVAVKSIDLTDSYRFLFTEIVMKQSRVESAVFLGRHLDRQTATEMLRNWGHPWINGEGHLITRRGTTSHEYRSQFIEALLDRFPQKDDSEPF